MQREAGYWTHPYLEELAHNCTLFADWPMFEAAFISKFEPVDATAEAKSVLLTFKQGMHDFSLYLAEFEI